MNASLPLNIHANGISIRYQIDGTKNAPWLVFSNSLMTNLSLWDDQVAAFGDRFQILRYDQRGHGGTTLDARTCNFDLLVDDVVGLLDALKIERFTFVGISMGSATALRIAQRYPDRVARIVMCAGNSHTGPGNAEMWQQRIDFARERGMEALVEPTVGRWFHPRSLQAQGPALDRVRNMVRTTPFEGFAACAQALQSFDFQSGLPAMRTPTLMIAGEGDAAATKGLSVLQGRIAGARYAMIPDSGHLTNIETPAAFNRLLAGFLSETGDR